jgi:hypothetical protein
MPQQYADARVHAGDAVIVVINNDAKQATAQFGVGAAGLADGVTLTDRLGTAGDVTVAAGAVRVTLPARAAAIYVAKK